MHIVGFLRHRSAICNAGVLAGALLFFLPSFASLHAQDEVAAAEPTSRYAPTAAPDRVVLTWTSNPATTLAVTWRTDSTAVETEAEIAEATDSDSFEEEAREVSATTTPVRSDNGLAHHHSVVFTGLEPNTLYAYRVEGGNGTDSEWFHFRTASDTLAPFSFIYFGDAQNEIKSLWSRAIRGAYGDLPEARFMVHAGDLVGLNPGDNHDDDWGEWFEAGGWLNGMVPSIPAAGNHEYAAMVENGRASEIHSGWNAHFTLPGHSVPEFDESVYHIDYQGVRFIVLNSMEVVRSGRGAEQAGWLEPLLADNPNRWTIVILHHPMFSVARGRDNPQIREHIQPLLDRYNVDLVLQGHDHAYGRGANVPGGTTVKPGTIGPMYVVSVSGPKMYNIAPGTEWMDRQAENTQLYQLIHVGWQRIRYEARTVTGTLYDAFDLVRQEGGGNALVNRIPDIPERRATVEP